MNNPAEYRANGKLLLAGEYLVTKGACALALPLRYGQSMRVEEHADHRLLWESIDPAGSWFSAAFDTTTLTFTSASDTATARVLQRWLQAARKLCPDFLADNQGYSVTVRAHYPPEWGWGSSSTLLFLLARWSGAVPMELHRLVSRGSGFDIACAGSSRLLFYQLLDGNPIILPTHPGKALQQNTWFCFLGNSQHSAGELEAFRSSAFTSADIHEISDISLQICRASTGEDLIRLVNMHEAILGRILKREPLGSRYPFFPGAVKSLGAWGGDFGMFVSVADPSEVTLHLKSLGFNIIFRYHEIAAKP